MPLLKPDPTFYPSPTFATQSPPEKLAYVALISPGAHRRSDAIGVVDVDPESKSYGRLVGQTDMPHAGDELHHFGMPGALSAATGEHAGHLAAAAGSVPWTNAAAVGVHTLAYLVVMTLLAWTVYRKLGLRLLRTAWFNLHWLWAGALVVTGAVVLLT